MLTNAIIAGLAQGNAVEMEILRKMKEGFDTLATGMLKECFNRNDALSALGEKMQNKHNDSVNAAERKGLLAHTIKDAIFECVVAVKEAKDQHHRKCRAATREYEDDKKRQSLLVWIKSEPYFEI